MTLRTIGEALLTGVVAGLGFLMLAVAICVLALLVMR